MLSRLSLLLIHTVTNSHYSEHGQFSISGPRLATDGLSERIKWDTLMAVLRLVMFSHSLFVYGSF